MRKAALAFLAVAVAGLVALLIVGATTSRTFAFTLGTPSFGAVATLQPGQEVCQLPVPVGAAFDEVELHVGTFGRPRGSELEVSIREQPGGAVLARGTLPAGYADNSRPTVDVGDVDDDGSVAICVRNTGSRRAALYGGPDVTARTSSAELDGRPLGADLNLVFRTSSPRSGLALLPDMLERASLFRGGWIGPWLYWLLLAGVLLAVPALIVRALTLTEDGDGREPDA